MNIGVTGATGHLGQAIMAQLPNAQPIYDEIPHGLYSTIIHCAAPNYRDSDEIYFFHDFIDDLRDYVSYTNARLVVVGSWWQYAQGTCRDLAYTQQKNYQAALFPQATHVIPYSIYGDEARPGRGFIPNLVEAIQGRASISRVSHELRDFIHVSDVARACISAIQAEPGIYAAQTRTYLTPEYIASLYGIKAPRYDEQPTAHPNMALPLVPNWRATINVLDHISHLV